VEPVKAAAVEANVKTVDPNAKAVEKNVKAAEANVVMVDVYGKTARVETSFVRAIGTAIVRTLERTEPSDRIGTEKINKKIILNEVPHTGSDRKHRVGSDWNATELFVDNILTDFEAFRSQTHAH
jgi:hypothetical protein